MNELINKYIERIKIDFPEDDKLMIDLKEFFNEAQNLVKNSVVLADVSEWHLFKDELPLTNEEILVRNGIGKEVRRSKWTYSIYLNDINTKEMQWKRWADACR